MDPLRKKKLNLGKVFFLQFFPYCILLFLLLTGVVIMKDGFHSTKPESHLSKCGDLPPGEVVPFNNLVTNAAAEYYYTVFQRLLKEGYVSPSSNALCIESSSGQDAIALRKTGIPEPASVKFVVSGQGSKFNHPFPDDSFDFEFFDHSSTFNWSIHPSHTASEIGRTLKVGGYFVIHLVLNDEYSYNSFINLFTCCRLVTSRSIRGLDNLHPYLYEVVLKKEDEFSNNEGSSKCTISPHTKKLIDNLEPLVTFEQPYHWDGPFGSENSTLQYLPSLVDLSFKERYIYVDVGANKYNSSIGYWFEKIYPKQNKTFEIYAIEADKAFQEEYKDKKGITLLPYAAWVRNETLEFEVDREPDNIGGVFETMGRIPEKKSSKKDLDYVENVFKVEAFDFVEWLGRTVTKKDFVVMKMDVEGSEVSLVNRLRETGLLCLIDEFFLECHYNRWFKCCSGEKSTKYKTTFAQCLDLFKKLREDGCIVHQWF